MILNLTLYPATPTHGIVELDLADASILQEALAFKTLPTQADLEARAETIAWLAGTRLARAKAPCAIIGGAPYLMAPLERALLRKGITPLHAFTVCELVSEVLPDGSTREVSSLRHGGFVSVAN